MSETLFVLHYGPLRNVSVHKDMSHVKDHPFSRMMPDEIEKAIDEMIKQGHSHLDLVLVEELPMTYLRFLKRTKPEEVDVEIFWWYADGGCRQIRLGVQGEYLDPWPTGSFDNSLKHVLGGW